MLKCLRLFIFAHQLQSKSYHDKAKNRCVITLQIYKKIYKKINP